MYYSQLLGKTKKEAPKDEESLNAQLLIRGGFIQKELAGVYAYLPLGLRVLKKISEILREEMLEIGGQEVFLGSLQDPELWKKTNRWADDVIDVWFKTKLNNGTEVGLANTHEEPLTKILSNYVQSYRDLPLYAFQFQTKFRNELRARSGLMRTREFIMKDLYSFNKDQTELDIFYDRVSEAYRRYFNRLGIGDITYLTFASGGAFSKYSHEFQTLCSTGEDTIYLSREKKLAVNKEVYTDEVLAELGLNRDGLEEVRAVETGNIFKLGTKYSEPLGLKYLDEQGKEQPVIMGCYGIAPSRSMGTIAEIMNDEKGLIWPESIAPFKVHLIGINLDDKFVVDKVNSLHEKLLELGIEVLYDDRENASAGEKLADADLIGCPYRAVVSKKTDSNVEVKKRNENEVKLMSVEDFIASLQKNT